MQFSHLALLLSLACVFVFVSAHPFDHLSHSKKSDAGCTTTYGQIEGPYWVDGQPVRSDIREAQAGVPLYLNLILLNQTSTSVCEPLVGVAADVWHTNASGYYAHFTGYSPDEPAGGGPGPAKQTDNLTFMRGVQITDAKGAANFITIYPGWYYGRCIHIHLEVHLSGSVVDGNFISDGSDAYIGQLFFDDSITAQIAKIEPYSAHTATTFLPNDQDFIYTGEHGADNALELVAVNPKDLTEGFTTTFVLNVDTSSLQKNRCAANRQITNFRSYHHLY